MLVPCWNDAPSYCTINEPRHARTWQDSALELFQNAVLPKLTDGPKSQLQLDVPRYALEALRARGLGRDAHSEVLDDHLQGRDTDVVLAEHEPAPLRDCAVMTFEGMA